MRLHKSVPVRTFFLWLDDRVSAGQFGPLGFNLTFILRGRVSLVHLTGLHSFQRTFGPRLRPQAEVESKEEARRRRKKKTEKKRKKEVKKK